MNPAAEPPQSPQQSKRNRWLDIVRALAIVLVVNCHVASSHSETFGSSLLTTLLGIGGHGVDLFFVLSGWLLGRLLFKESKANDGVDVKKFLKRRWMRTLPAYYTVLTLTLLQAALQDRFTTQNLSYFVFLQGYVYETLPTFPISWSLCVEEHFYLLIAPLISFIGRRRWIGCISLAFLTIVPMLCRHLEFYNDTSQSHVRVDQCTAGVAIAYLNIYFPQTWIRFQRALPSLLAAGFCIGMLALSQRMSLIQGKTPYIAFTFMSIVVVALSERSNWWIHRVYVPGSKYLATRSYSLYLLHVEALAVCDRLQINNLALRFVVTWCIGLALAEILYRLVELPFMRLRPRT